MLIYGCKTSLESASSGIYFHSTSKWITANEELLNERNLEISIENSGTNEYSQNFTII